MNVSSPLDLPCGAKIKNRIGKSALSENMAEKDNCPGDKFEKLYSTWNRGGAGLLMTGNIMCDGSARGEIHNVVLEKEHECLEGLGRWAKAATANETHCWTQINHPGKQSPKFLSKVPVAPSAIGYDSDLKTMFNPPRELSGHEVEEVIARYITAAEISKRAGFTGVQIHGAHGYLVSQFLSPLHNQRRDKFGGNLENRMRFVLEIYRGMRNALGEKFPIGIKLNSSDFQKGGFSEEDSMVVVKTLAEEGMDLIEISGGTYEAPVMTGVKIRESTKKREAYFLDYAAKVRKITDVPLMITGGFRTTEGINQALSSGAMDMVGLGRSVVLEPDFPQKVLRGESATSLVHPLTSGVKVLDKIFPLEIIWYTHQIHRLGSGKATKPNASPLMVILRSIVDLGLNGMKPVRKK